MKKSSPYEEEYFEGFYHHISDFSRRAFNKNVNWFKGMFNAIDPYADILNGTNKSAIEFGCTTGAASRVLSDFGYNVLATDISSYAIKRAKNLNPDISFLKHDIEKPLRGTKRYDLVLALDVIEHLKNPQKAIRNMYNLVKTDGLVLCSTPNDSEEQRKMATHINIKNPGEWKQILQDAGFKNITIKRITFFFLLYRLHWRLFFFLPFGINSPLFISPVFIFARK